MLTTQDGDLWNGEIAQSYQVYSEKPSSIYYQTNKVLIKLIPHGNYKQVLDLGCGNGITTFYLLKRFKPTKIIALDVSIDQLQRYKKKFESQKKTDLELVNKSFSEFESFESSIDLIVSNASINHLGNISDIFMTCSKLIKKNGIFAFSVFDQVSGETQESFYPRLTERLRDYTIRTNLEFCDVFNPKITIAKIDKLSKKYCFSKEHYSKLQFEETNNLINTALEHYADRLLYKFFPTLPKQKAKTLILKEGKKLLNEGNNKRIVSFHILKKK